MRMKGLLTGSVLGVGCLFAAVAVATEAWPVITPATLEGVWVSVDYDSGTVFRLEIKGSTGVLAVTAGAKQGEFLFRSEGVTVRRGKVSFVAVDEALDLSLRLTGEGRALGEHGKITLSMANVTRKPTCWEDTERDFVKGPAQPRLEYLIQMDERAKALTEGREHRREEKGRNSDRI